MSQEYKKVALSEVLQLSIDAVPVDNCETYPISGVYSYGRGLFARQPLSGTQTTYKFFHKLHENDFVLSQLKGWEGALAKVTLAFEGWFLSPQFATFRVIDNKLDINFLDWYCKQSKVCEELKYKSSGMGARRDTVSPKKFLSIEIPLPPLDEQRRIVARIEELAAKVEEARGLRRQSVEYGLPSLRNGIFRKAFQGKFLDYSATEFDKDEIPSIGKWVKLGDICSLITDGTHQTPTYTEKGMMFLSAQNIKPYRFMPKNHKYVSYEDYLAYTARNKVKKGDILITRVGAGIGEVAMVDQDIDFAIYVSLGHIRAIQDFVYTPYLVHWLNSPAGVAQSREKILGRGHSQGNLNLNLIRQFLVPLPSLPEQHRIVAYLDDLQAKVDALKRLQTETAAELDALLPSILDKAFKGEL